MENNQYPFVNTPLPYAYHALEPFIDEKTMELHHDKHLQAYIDHLNAALKCHPSLQRMSLEQLLRCSGNLPARLRIAIQNNAGGVYNHRFFFESMTNPALQAPVGLLGREIQRQFDGFDSFAHAMKKAALSVFGSGYAWLVSKKGRLSILCLPNQATPIERGFSPILVVDVWEHAYYLKHYNVRGDYIDDWARVIDWERAEREFRADAVK